VLLVAPSEPGHVAIGIADLNAVLLFPGFESRTRLGKKRLRLRLATGRKQAFENGAFSSLVSSKQQALRSRVLRSLSSCLMELKSHIRHLAFPVLFGHHDTTIKLRFFGDNAVGRIWFVGCTGHPSPAVFALSQPGDHHSALAISLLPCPDSSEFDMKGPPGRVLSPVENEIIAEIRKLRASQHRNEVAFLLDTPTRLVRHLIVAARGNVKMRIAPVARELGIEMRSLQRGFRLEYGETMIECHAAARLTYAKWMLGIDPPIKISAVASYLGYDRVQDFNRFFKQHLDQSPTAWSRRERERVRQGRGPS